jgi:hypothetical protein
MFIGHGSVIATSCISLADGADGCVPPRDAALFSTGVDVLSRLTRAAASPRPRLFTSDE